MIRCTNNGVIVVSLPRIATTGSRPDTVGDLLSQTVHFPQQIGCSWGTFQSTREYEMDTTTIELIAIGAAVTANCVT